MVITDYADNLRRIQRIIESIDTPATSDVEIIPVKNGLALEIATVVNRVLDEGARAAGQATDAGQRISLLAEPRTNSIIIRAPSPQRLQLAKSLIAQLDKPALTPGNINVIHLRNAEAIRLAPLLRAIIGSDPSFVPQGSGGSGLSPTTPLGPGSTPGQPGTTLGAPCGPAPGGIWSFLFEEGNAVAWLYDVSIAIPIVALLVLVGSPRGKDLDARQTRAVIASLAVLALILDRFFLRNNFGARFGDLESWVRGRSTSPAPRVLVIAAASSVVISRTSRSPRCGRGSPRCR